MSFRPSVSFPTQASWIAEKKRQGVFVERKFKAPVVQSRMYGRPQLSAMQVRPPPKRSIPLPRIDEILAALSPSKKAVVTPPLGLERKDSFSEDDCKTMVVSDVPSPLKLMAKAMFKADHPYRTRLGAQDTMVTSAAGLLNRSELVSNLSTVAEWTAIDALFDEFFVHSLTAKYTPYNSYGGGQASVSSSIGTMTALGGGVVANQVNACGIGAVALFSDSGLYGSFVSMLANPTFVLRMSNEPFTFVWRNNVRFDPRGVSIDVSSSTLGWQGWAAITATAKYGGLIQFRTVNDQVLGDTSHTFVCGHLTLVYDVSFRARA